MKIAWFLSLLIVIVFSYQNCAVYKSPGLNQFEQSLQGPPPGQLSCNYINNQEVANYNGTLVSSITSYASTTLDSNQQINSYICNFASAAGIFSNIACDVSKNNAVIVSNKNSFANCSSGSATTSSCQDLFQLYFGGDESSGIQFSTYLDTSGDSSPSGFSGSSFAFIYTSQNAANVATGGVDYHVKYLAVQNGLWGASCAALIQSSTPQETDLSALANITKTMAIRASSGN